MWNWLSGVAPHTNADADEDMNLTVFSCENDQDNIPVVSVAGLPPDESLFCISQSRIPGYKPNGQDCMSTASKGDWVCSVLCDGHDRDGLIVARAICTTLPRLVLNKVVASNSDGTDVPDSVLSESFLECERTVCWTNEGICKGMFVRVSGGEYDGKVGYVKEVMSHEKFRLVIVDEKGYHKPLVHKSNLNGAKFAGGCTCVCFLRNTRTNKSRIAFVGDSRAMLVYPQQNFNGVFEPCADDLDDSGYPVAVATRAHNLANQREMDRLRQGNPKDYEIDGDFLVSPITGFAIQPTRGFGDFDMYGTGYTSLPEISETFQMKPGMLIMVASDGIFDSHVWHDGEIVEFFQRHSEYETDLEELADGLYDDTLVRSQDGGYVDDISFFLFSPAEPEVPVAASATSNPFIGSPESLAQEAAAEAQEDAKEAKRRARKEAEALREKKAREKEAKLQAAMEAARQAEDLERRLRAESYEASAAAEAERIREEVRAALKAAKEEEERKKAEENAAALESVPERRPSQGLPRLSKNEPGAGNVPVTEQTDSSSRRTSSTSHGSKSSRSGKKSSKKKERSKKISTPSSSSRRLSGSSSKSDKSRRSRRKSSTTEKLNDVPTRDEDATPPPQHSKKPSRGAFKLPAYPRTESISSHVSAAESKPKKKGLLGEEGRKPSFLQKLMGKKPVNKRSYLQKSKSMSALSIRNNRKMSSPANANVRQREHVPSSAMLSDDERRRRRGKSLELDESAKEEILNKRNTIRRGGGGSFTDLAQFSLTTGNFAASQRQLSVSVTDPPVAAAAPESREERKSKIEIFKEQVRLRKKEEEERLRTLKVSELAEGAGKSGPSTSEQMPGAASEEDLVHAILARIASKFGHEIGELEEVAKEVKHLSIRRN